MSNTSPRKSNNTNNTRYVSTLYTVPNSVRERYAKAGWNIKSNVELFDFQVDVIRRLLARETLIVK